jgi:hypothetical protein
MNRGREQFEKEN